MLATINMVVALISYHLKSWKNVVLLHFLKFYLRSVVGGKTVYE
tara:strand:+ start:1780 stop:1911 length:132 start_codon:yes stop_codon:yes gene_type:complete